MWVHVFSDDLITHVSKDDLWKYGDILRGESENKYKKSLNYSYKKGNHNSPDQTTRVKKSDEVLGILRKKENTDIC